MQGKWFGRQVELHTFPAPNWWKIIKMTATATIYTPFGFAVAADGREYWAHEPTRSAMRRSESDKVQKIFRIDRSNAALACLLHGHTANHDRSWDLASDLVAQLSTLSRIEFASCDLFLRTLADRLEDIIELAQRDGMLEGEHPAAHLLFAGYYKSIPVLKCIEFRPYRDPTSGHLYGLLERELYHGLCVTAGSETMDRLISNQDSRFMQYCTPPNPTTSLQEAVGIAEGYIKACSSDLARQLDPGCEHVGGHIHSATITQDHGFKWIRPPVNGR